MKPLRILFNLFSCCFSLLFLLLIISSQAAEKTPSQDTCTWKVAFLVEEGKVGQALSQAACLSISDLSRETGKLMYPLFISVGRSKNSCSFEDLPEYLEAQDVSAAISLLRGSSLFSLSQVWDQIHIPVILTWSERICLSGKTGENEIFHFGLDFTENFLPPVVALWAKERNEQNWSIFVDHLDGRSTRMGRMLSDQFFSSEIDSMSMEFLRNTRYGFSNSSEECVSSGTENILSWLVPSDTIKLQRSLRFLGAYRTRLIHGGPVQDFFLGTDGITLFSQDPFPDKDVRERLKKTFPPNLMEDISVTDLIKVRAAVQWLARGISLISDEDCSHTALALCIERVTSLSLPGFSVEFSLSLHRPLQKTIFILRSYRGEWVKEDEIRVDFFRDGTCSIVQ